MSNSSSSSSVKFDAPEFDKVFKKINEYQNKQGYHSLRQLNKFHAEKFEKSINSANLNIQNIRSLTNSKFVDSIRFLNVQVPNNLRDLSDLRYIAPTFLYNIKKVNVVFTEGQYVQKQMTISQPLIFREVNFIHGVTKSVFTGSQIVIQSENQDIQIIECSFEGIGLQLYRSKDITLENSTFRNAYIGLFISQCQNNAPINKIVVQKCEMYGCYFVEVNELNLNGAEIVDCEEGIRFFNSFGNIQNSIIDAWNRDGWEQTTIYEDRIDLIDLNRIDSVINEVL